MRLRVLLLALLVTACERSLPTQDSGGGGELRIVSLSPAITRTLVDFGLEKRIVGRTPYCDSIDRSIPVVGSLLDVDYERLLKLEPTHVLVQPSLAQGVEPRLRELAESHHWTIGEFPGLNTIDDIEALILALPELLYADGSQARHDAAARAADLTTQIADALVPAGDDAWKGSTLFVGGTEPVYIVGKETYLHDILIALGGTNAAHVAGWAELSLEDVIRLDPEAIILVREMPIGSIESESPPPEPSPPSEPPPSESRPQGSGERARADAIKAALGPLADLPIRAVEHHRLAVLVHPDVNLPSSGVIGVAAALRDVLESLGSGASEPTP